MDPISRSTYGFCQGDCAAVNTSFIPMPFATAITSFPKIASRSRIKYLGASSHGNASRICCAVHVSVGCSVTLKCTHSPSVMGENDEYEQQSEQSSGHDKEVHRRHLLHV